MQEGSKTRETLIESEWNAVLGVNEEVLLDSRLDCIT